MSNTTSTDRLFSVPKEWTSLFSTSTPWSPLLLLLEFLHSCNLGVIETDLSSLVFVEKKELVSIGNGTVIEKGAYIEGPCIIGPNCTIRHGSYIRGGSLIGEGAVVGHATEIKHSILLPFSKAAHFAYIGDSIVGQDANLGAGVKCANVRLDRKEVIVRVNGEKMNTGLRKLGALLGDRVQVGCNAVLNPGTVMGKGATCYPCLNIGGEIPEGGTASSLLEKR